MSGPPGTASHDLGVAYPGISPRLVIDGARAEDIGAYRSRGGYRPLRDAEAFVCEVEESGLRGRGGAAFPAGRKLRAVRAGDGVPVVVANGEEGEPASVKDRWLMRHRPHLVLDGLRLAAQAAGTGDAHVFVSDPGSERSIRSALEAARKDPSFGVEVSIARVAPAYVAGEETAVVQALNGGPALPMDKPPRPFESGVGGRPTLVANVETLANLPWVRRLGAAGYREVGTEKAPGTFLMTLTIRGRAGLYEIPFGTALRDVLAWLGEDAGAVRGFLMGGYFAGVVGEHALDVPLEYDTFADLGSGLGCGAVVALGRDDCSVATTAAVMAYFARENAGQCGSCFNGTAAMSAVLQALRDQRAGAPDLERLRGWSTGLRGRGACGTLDGATNVAAALLREFPEAVAAHLDGRCGICAGAGPAAAPPAVAAMPAAGS
ncbi:NADH-ubiquinone oxidoreductase-F iron-sulfur binding region domain-containing protein [Spirillospora sp. NPDC029432]|uniref:NADH-ubiquinone oxidoreductase-F iron-sulfur binding region domain-containing protein n=1 Tax=Spirillospora sp. NPDC029432 TaxID=3154599 RepID=UPI003455D4C2